MRIITTLISIMFIINSAHATGTKNKAGKEETNIASLSAKQKTNATFFINLSCKEYEQLTGRHLSFLERIVFKWTQKLTHKNFEGAKQSKGFDEVGFFVPLLLGIIGIPLGLLTGIGILAGVALSFLGVCLVAIFSTNKNMHKWAWIGFGAYVAGLIVLFVILLTTGYFAE